MIGKEELDILDALVRAGHQVAVQLFPVGFSAYVWNLTSGDRACEAYGGSPLQALHDVLHQAAERFLQGENNDPARVDELS